MPPTLGKERKEGGHLPINDRAFFACFGLSRGAGFPEVPMNYLDVAVGFVG